MQLLQERLSVAPMMEWTDPHFRVLMRGITRKSVLYTEMVVDGEVLNIPNLDFLIGRNGDAYPSVIQLGGSDPEMLAEAAARCEAYSEGRYGEINLNCGCPSERVARHCFGARLMLDPDLVRRIVYSMQRRVSIPVTVKCRIGVDAKDSYEDLTQFIALAHQGGANKFIIHARKCINGLSTKQNRDIPPLKYDVPRRLVRDFPELQFVVNGGVQSLEEASQHFTDLVSLDNEVLPAMHGVMIGRLAYNNPVSLCRADSMFYGERDPCLSRRQIIERYLEYCDWIQSEDGPHRFTKSGKKQITSSMLLINAMRNVINGIPCVQKFRTALNDHYVEQLHLNPNEANPNPRIVVR